MFPFLMQPWCHSSTSSRTAYRLHQLEFLKWMRDSLETRLAAVNAAIAVIEQQTSSENSLDQSS